MPSVWIAALLLFPLLAPAISPATPAMASGPDVGSEAPAFDPLHVAGPDAGTHACPMCKYGSGQGVMIWVNTEDLGEAAAMAARLEREISARGLKRMRAFVIFMNPAGRPLPQVQDRLRDFARQAGLRRVAVLAVPSPTDGDTSGLYDINPDAAVRTTALVYRKRRVFAKFINLAPDEEGLGQLVRSVEQAEASGP